MTVELGRKTMLEAFKQKMAPTMFLSGFFRTPPRNITRSRKVVIDVKRNDEAIAIDVVRGTGGRKNDNKRFTTKEYAPPMYDESSAFNEEELMERAPGSTEYTDTAYIAELIARITDDQVQHQEMIMRAVEKQAADVFFTGTVPLINNDTIDFKQKNTHAFTVSTDWNNANGVPLTDLATACDLNRKDGKVESNIVIMGDQAVTDFLDNAQVKAIGDFRRINRIDITPPTPNTEGAKFHGEVSVGSYRLQIWTYPQFYKVPLGFSLANEGTLVPYIPTDKVVVTGSAVRFDLVYAGIPDMVRRVDPRLESLGLPAVPMSIATDFHPYAHLDDRAVNIDVGVRSAPLCIPTQIDGYTTIDTRA